MLDESCFSELLCQFQSCIAVNDPNPVLSIVPHGSLDPDPLFSLAVLIWNHIIDMAVYIRCRGH